MRKAFLYLPIVLLILTLPGLTLSANAGGQAPVPETGTEAGQEAGQPRPNDIPLTVNNPAPGVQPLANPCAQTSSDSTKTAPLAMTPAKPGMWSELMRMYGNSWINSGSKKAAAAAPSAPTPPVSEALPVAGAEPGPIPADKEIINNASAPAPDAGVADDGADGAADLDDIDAPDYAPEGDLAEADNDLPDVPMVMNNKVEAYIKYFQGRGRKHFVKWLERSSNYMPVITDILSEEGVPEDLFYIAFIESGLSPNAKSRAKAVGMWQFIKGTAKKYGLRVDWWMDERRDPEKSTRAAARYFKSLYGRFGSWYLAAAGYNAGEGRIIKAIKRRGSTDFWEISTPAKKGHRRVMKKETRDYVPKYLAAMIIAKDPASYGFDVPADTGGITYDRVKVAGVTDLKVIAEASGALIDEIKKLNPELLHWFTPPNYPEYELKLPPGTGERFMENIGKIPPSQRVKFHQHKVKRGDSISKIARIYGTNVKPILYLNNIKNLRGIRPGTTILIPVRAAEQKNGKSIADVVDVRWKLRG